MRRLRKSGFIPGILYGHGEDNIALSIDARDVNTMIRHGSHIVELTGDLKESALVKAVQWDALGSDVMHLDLTRVDASESVEVQLSVELKGVAPGTKQGGIVKHLMHDISIRCPANQMPDRLELSINGLELEQSLTAGDIALPDAVELVGDESEIVVTCVAQAVVEEEPEEVAEEAAEPEVIGRRPEDEQADESKS